VYANDAYWHLRVLESGNVASPVENQLSIKVQLEGIAARIVVPPLKGSPESFVISLAENGST
jgi:hypothetical protein